MSDAKSRGNLKKFLPDDFEIDKALEAALKDEESRTHGPLVGPELVRLREGSVVKGKVLAVVEDRVVVDVSYKAEGVIPLDEFGENPPAPGAEVEAAVLKVEDENGQVKLSIVEAARRKVWDSVTGGEKNPIVRGKVVEAVKGGLVVDVGLRAFMPAREADIRFVEDLGVFVGKTIEARVIEADRENRKVVLSRRAILQEERTRKKEALFATLAPGQSLKGTVTNVTDFGAFVDIGGAEGLIHKGDLAWGKVGHPSEILKNGQEITVSVLTFDRSSGKIGLGLKQTGPSPWDAVPQRYPVGRRLKARVVGLLDFGAMMELEPGIQGLCHVSEMSWNRRVRNPGDVVELNQEVEIEVVGLDLEKKKIGLSIKRVEENPYATLEQRYPYATIVRGTVSELADFGAFVRLEDGVEGLVHVSELSWTKRVKHPSELLKPGDPVTAIVVGNDPARQRLSLSIRLTEPDPWWDVETRYPKGRQVAGTVARLEPFGAFVTIENGLEGLVHISRMGGEGRVNRPQDVVKVGDPVSVEVVEVSEENRRLGLRLLHVEGAGPD